MIGLLSFKFSISWFHAVFWKHLSSICIVVFAAVNSSHFCWWSNLAASGYCIQIEMNLDPLGLGVFTTHFKILASENLDLPFWYVDSKAVSSALRLAPTFLSPRSTWISIIQAPKADCIYIQSGFGARIIIQAPKADPKFIIDFYIYSLVSELE